MNSDRSFGGWLRQHRRALDLTQAELATRVGCSAIELRKLEAEERRPSKKIAERLAQVLQVPPDDREAFLRFARGDPFAAPKTAAAAARPAEPTAPRHNLPLQLTRFIGREKEIAAVQDLLASARLVTLTGAGGCGKTRLALQVAGGLLGRFADGVWWIELAALGDPALVPPTVAAVLGVPEQADRPLVATLAGHLRDRSSLLVLDNCEHLIAACAGLAEALLRACPRLRVLVTSREALQMAGEAVFVVPPLASPDRQHLPSLEATRQYEAVQLFVDRAGAALAGFSLTTANAPAVAQVCYQLDGIPLAIELAAARVKLLKVEQIAERLHDRFELLRGGSRTALPRHQTLTALFDWSYDLLSEPERSLLQRLSVFAGGWMLPAAEVVGDGARGSAGTLDLLTQLVNKSLVVAVRPAGEEARYRMLETVRQYARAKLEASGQADAVRRRHSHYYLALTEPLASAYGWPDASAKRFDLEFDNLLAALAWSQLAAGDEELWLRLLERVSWLWWRHTYVTEMRQWLEAAVARPGVESHPQALAGVLWRIGVMLTIQGEYGLAYGHFARALRLVQKLGDKPGSAHMLERLGWLAREQGDVVTARRWLEQSLALWRELGDRSGIVVVLNTLGKVLVMQEDAVGAQVLLDESLALSGQVGDTEATGWALSHLGQVAQLEGDGERARRLHEESLRVFHQIGPRYVGVAEANQCLGQTALSLGDGRLAAKYFAASLELSRHLGDQACQFWCLAGLAGVAVLDEEPRCAARLWGAAETLRHAIGTGPAPASRETRERLMASAREQLGYAEFTAAWTEGEKLTTEQAIELALAEAE